MRTHVYIPEYQHDMNTERTRSSMKDFWRLLSACTFSTVCAEVFVLEGALKHTRVRNYQCSDNNEFNRHILKNANPLTCAYQASFHNEETRVSVGPDFCIKDGIGVVRKKLCQVMDTRKQLRGHAITLAQQVYW